MKSYVEENAIFIKEAKVENNSLDIFLTYTNAGVVLTFIKTQKVNVKK